MRVIRINDINHLPFIGDNIVAAHGFFDGVHLGHLRLIETTKKIAKENNYKTGVITFFPNPHLLFNLENQILNYGEITPQYKKIKLIEELGVDYVFVVNILKFKSVIAKDYIKDFIYKLNIRHLVIGYDNRYGKDGEGAIDTIKEHSEGFIDYTVCDPVMYLDKKVSTTRIKRYIDAGDFDTASKLLTRNYSITGIVFEGRQIGRTIGYPTANLYVNDNQYKPGPGVYATYAYIDGKKYKSMTNVGTNPTVCNNCNVKIEAHILDEDLDLYNKKITVEFIKKIRDEVKFKSLDHLKEQLNKDKSIIKSII